MYFLIYVSIATVSFSTAELIDLLQHARRNNEKANVTGMLLFKDGNFMQILEGEERVVKALAAKISRDPRHSKMITMLEGPLAEREFENWSMGFSNLDAVQTASIPGHSEFMNTARTAESFAVNPTRAQRLLHVYKQS